MTTSSPLIPRRPYGKSKINLSVIGFGGIIVMNAEQDTANRAVAKAIDHSINYFDVAPSYGDAEVKLGPALEPYRKDVFLACKTGQRTLPEAREEFDRSLERLRTDYFDLYQLHAITDVEKDVDVAFGPNGVMKMIDEEKKAGRIRHVGFSAHSMKAALAALDRYPFDSVLMPVNYATWMAGNFGPVVVDKIKETGTSLLALKAMARGHWEDDDPKRGTYGKCWYEPMDNAKLANLAVRWTLSQPVTACLPPGEEALWSMALGFEKLETPLNEAEIEELKSTLGERKLIFEYKR